MPAIPFGPPVRSTSPKRKRAVRVVHEDDEDLAEEERHDREVVAEQPPRRQPERAGRAAPSPTTTIGIASSAGQWMPNLVRREERVRVRAEAVERDVAEVEQAGEADDDVQAEREQRVDEREEAVRGTGCPSRDQNGSDARRDRRTRAAAPAAAGASHARVSRPLSPRRCSRRSSTLATHSSTPISGVGARRPRAIGGTSRSSAIVRPSGSPPCRAGRSAGTSMTAIRSAKTRGLERRPRT